MKSQSCFFTHIMVSVVFIDDLKEINVCEINLQIMLRPLQACNTFNNNHEKLDNNKNEKKN